MLLQRGVTTLRLGGDRRVRMLAGDLKRQT